MGSGYAVIDTETTGFGPQDRVIEVGVVLLGPELEPEGEWDTLINPHRGLGPTHIHRITRELVADAPDFAATAGPLAGQLQGRVIVGHNLSFDARMLNQEYDRLGAGRPLGRAFGVDTLELTRSLKMSATGVYTLEHLCGPFAIGLAGAHAALADARATAELFRLAAPRLQAKLAQLKPHLAENAPATLAALWADSHSAAARAEWPSFPDRPFQRVSRTA
jgi:DNA polymerase-3 subunit epsilon